MSVLPSEVPRARTSIRICVAHREDFIETFKAALVWKELTVGQRAGHHGTIFSVEFAEEGE